VFCACSKHSNSQIRSLFCPASWKRTLSAGHRHCLSIWEPERNHIHDPTRGFGWWLRPSVSTAKVHLWPQPIGKRIVLSALKFPAINWIWNLSNRTMLAGWRWSSAFHLCWWHPCYVKNKAGLWKISSSEVKIKELGMPNTYWVSVLSLWRVRFHSLNASILKNSYALSPSTKETRSTTQWSPTRLQESFWNLKMKNSILICTASSSEVWCNLLPGQDQIFHIPCQFFRNLFPNPARRHWTLARRVANYLKTTQDSVLFLSSQQGGPVTSSPMLKAAVNSELLTFTDSDFAFCEKTRKSSLIYWKPGKQNHVSRSTTEAEFYAFLEGITEVEFLQDVIHFAYKVDKRIFNCKNTPIFCDNSSAGKIANSIESIARTKHIEVWQVSLYRKKSNSQPLPRRGTTTLKFCGSYACKT